MAVEGELRYREFAPKKQKKSKNGDQKIRVAEIHLSKIAKLDRQFLVAKPMASQYEELCVSRLESAQNQANPFLHPRLRGGFAPAWVVQTLPGLNQRGSHSGLYEFGREVRQEQCEQLRGTATPQHCQPERCECGTVLGRPRQLVLPHVRGCEPPAQ